MAKSKTRSTSSAVEKKAPNALVEQYYAIRAEVRKVAWPTRDEARQLTIAITVSTIIIAIFLFLVDLLFEGIVTGLMGANIPWIVVGVVVVTLVTMAFFVNNRDV